VTKQGDEWEEEKSCIQVGDDTRIWGKQRKTVSESMEKRETKELV